jgi:hypothetical protein
MLTTPFVWPDLTGRSLLLLGLGGGADILTVAALRQLIPGTPRRVLLANTKESAEHDLIPVTPHIGRLPPGEPTPLNNRRRLHGSTWIDRSLTRTEDGPLIVVLRRQSERDLSGEIVSLGVDAVIGVDTGGDALVDEASSGDSGRDKRMLRVLANTGLPLWVVIVAPGSDGESSGSAIESAFAQHRDQYRGCIDFAPVMPYLDTISTGLPAKRTPRIMTRAWRGELQEEGDRVVVPRGCGPLVPRAWLTHGFVFAGG